MFSPFSADDKTLWYFHLLTSEMRAAKGFSQAYILMIRIPDTTSFMVRILLSVSTAVLLLRTESHSKWVSTPQEKFGGKLLKGFFFQLTAVLRASETSFSGSVAIQRETCRHFCLDKACVSDKRVQRRAGRTHATA